MSFALAEKIKQDPDFLEHLEKIKLLLGKVDKKALEKALQEKNLGRAAEILGLTEGQLKSFLDLGLEKAHAFAKRHPEVAEAAKKKK
jgi:hypothetical protein